MLMGIRQEEGETLRQYVSRFATTCIPLEKDQPSLCIAAFKSGLLLGAFNNDLNRKAAKTFHELKSRADEFILDEEDDMNKREIYFQNTSYKGGKGKAPIDDYKGKKQATRQDNNHPFYSGRQDRGDLIMKKGIQESWNAFLLHQHIPRLPQQLKQILLKCPHPLV